LTRPSISPRSALQHEARSMLRRRVCELHHKSVKA
jgi:hypothetical protein